MINIIDNQKGGTAILLVVLVLTTIISATLVASIIVKNSIVMSRDQIYSTMAFYAAEAGVERFLWDARYTTGIVGPCDTTTNKYLDFNNTPAVCGANESYISFFTPVTTTASTTATFVKDETFDTYHFFGTYRNLQRRVEVIY